MAVPDEHFYRHAQREVPDPDTALVVRRRDAAAVRGVGQVQHLREVLLLPFVLLASGLELRNRIAFRRTVRPQAEDRSDTFVRRDREVRCVRADLDGVEGDHLIIDDVSMQRVAGLRLPGSSCAVAAGGRDDLLVPRLPRRPRHGEDVVVVPPQDLLPLAVEVPDHRRPVPRPRQQPRAVGRERHRPCVQQAAELRQGSGRGKRSGCAHRRRRCGPRRGRRGRS